MTFCLFCLEKGGRFCIKDRFLSVIDNFSKSDLKDLLTELDLLKKLKPHPNVIQLLGCVTKNEVRCKGRRDLSKLNTRV